MSCSTHPVLEAVASVRAVLAGVAGRPAWSLTGAEQAEVLVQAAAARAQLAELELRVAAQAERDGAGSAVGAAGTAAWWAGTTGQTRPAARRRLRWATALDTDRQHTRQALAAGAVSEEQAGVILEAVAALPTTGEHAVDPETVELAEKELVRLADAHDPHDLRRLGARILQVVAPEVAEEHERRQVEAAEERAWRRNSLTMCRDVDGLVHGRFTLGELTAAQLRTMVQACWHPDLGAGPVGQGRALTELIERWPVDAVPTAGGVAATVTVQMTLAQLREDPDSAGTVPLDTGDTISAGQARRLACEAGIIPLVLGGRSAVLDVGRAARFHTKPQRVAIAQRDRTCTAEGCDYPPGLCHVHHDTPWSEGGHTSVETGRLLCPTHHRMLHSGHYTTSPSPSQHGRLVFRRE